MPHAHCSRPRMILAQSFSILDRPNLLMVHNHMFPAANTGLAAMIRRRCAARGGEGIPRRRDSASICSESRTAARSIRPSLKVRPDIPALSRARITCWKRWFARSSSGHPLTQGTVDSNEVWVDVTVADPDGKRHRPQWRDRPAERSRSLVTFHQRLHAGSRRQPDRPPKPARHFHAALQPSDSAGRGIGRSLQLHVPEELNGPLTVTVKVQYRKFDTTYMQYVFGKDHVNDFPGGDHGQRHVVFPIAGAGNDAPAAAVSAPARRPHRVLSRSGSDGTTTALHCFWKAAAAVRKGS